MLEKLADALRKAVREPDAQRRYDGLDATNPNFYRADFDRFIGAEARRRRRVVAERKIKPE